MKTNYPNNALWRGFAQRFQPLFKFILPLLVALLFTTELAAQQFDVTPQKRGEAKAYGVVRDDQNNWNATGDNIILQEGEKIQVIEIAKKNAYVFMRDGQYYQINPKELTFSEENGPEVENPISKKILKQNTALANFYRSSGPAWIVVLLLAAVAILAGFYLWTGWFILRLPTLIAIPAILILISAIEVVGYLSVESDLFWWCDYDTYGFFGSLFRLIPFVAVVWMQFYSIRLFEKVIFLEKKRKDPDNFLEEEHKISIKPIVIGLLLCVPSLIITALILQKVLGSCNTPLAEAIMVIAFFGSMVLGLLITLRKNSKVFGPINGLLITIFSVAYALGSIVAIGGIIVVAFQLILQILTVLAAIVVILIISPKRRFRGSDGRIYEEY